MNKNLKTKKIENAIVGGGAAGLYALQVLLDKGISPQDIVLLESAPHLGGRAKNSLHLIDADASQVFPMMTGTLLAPVSVRWDREWMPFDQVKWDSKEWVAQLPQWKFLDNGIKTLLLDLVPMDFASKEDEALSLHFQSPVSAIERLEDAWSLTTPHFIYEVKNVFWTAGLKSFQNACGKHEAQKFLVSNEEYNSVAADYRGGIGFDLVLPKTMAQSFEWEEGFDKEAIIALPLRYEGKYHLMIVVIYEDEQSFVLKSLTHVHQEILVDPKAVSAFQKSIRRVVKTLVKGGELPSEGHEKWVVSDRVLGHQLGTPWLLNSDLKEEGLVFVGDESSASQLKDTLGAFQSVRHVMDQYFEVR